MLEVVKKEIIRLAQALMYSYEGLIAAFKSEAAFRLELLIAVIFIPVALFLQVSAVAKVLMISSILLVLIAELINTAIEAVIDRISMERHSLSKKAKDIGSATVLVAMINVACTWLVILIF
ncbi:diacylglycerol kinase [Piscirickettsia litoralis]|uniref:Diacylglycerol kinase n=1 Tax=Piscirickettsia litoralis TaxID=1891921 RepID=A0ABX3A2B5_9GAMM|nr:diacylglycerol kinase [Piscirickettsia litoralis]ODN43007.1 diacylglycerol kinase [Piscirickettsia litoralis]